MKFSTAAVLTLFTTAQAGPMAVHVRHANNPVDTRDSGDVFGSLSGLTKKQAAGDAETLAALQTASTALSDAQVAVDDAIASVGGEEAAGEDAEVADDAANTDDDAAEETGAAEDAAATEGAALAGAGGDIVAQTLDGLLLPDGRIAADAVVEDFNVVASPFKSAVVKGEGLLFSDVITFPDVEPSMFDVAGGTKAFTININDDSIFSPGGDGGEPQIDFRRADLLPSIISTAEDSAVTGLRTIHFSLQQDTTQPLALTTNEYQLAFLETADFTNRQFDVRVGTGGTSPSLTGENIVVLGRSGDAIEEIFVAPFSEDIQNFGITLDFDANTMEVFHSVGQTPLASVSEVVANDNSGGGEYHFGLVKLADAEGVQAAGIAEGIHFSGIFMEDSTGGVVTLQ